MVWSYEHPQALDSPALSVCADAARILSTSCMTCALAPLCLISWPTGEFYYRASPRNLCSGMQVSVQGQVLLPSEEGKPVLLARIRDSQGCWLCHLQLHRKPYWHDPSRLVMLPSGW